MVAGKTAAAQPTTNQYNTATRGARADRREPESSHGRGSSVVLPPSRREGEPRGGRPALAVAGPGAIAEQGAVRQKRQPVVDEAKMGGEGEQRQLQGKSESKRKACLVLSCGHGLAGVHVRFSFFPLILPDPGRARIGIAV